MISLRDKFSECRIYTYRKCRKHLRKTSDYILLFLMFTAISIISAAYLAAGSVPAVLTATGCFFFRLSHFFPVLKVSLSLYFQLELTKSKASLTICCSFYTCLLKYKIVPLSPRDPFIPCLFF